MKKLIFGLTFVFFISYFPGIKLVSANVLSKSEIQKPKSTSEAQKTTQAKRAQKTQTTP